MSQRDTHGPATTEEKWAGRLRHRGLRLLLPAASLDYLVPLLVFAERESEGLLHSFRYAFAGLWYALRTQRNLRIHLTAAFLVILMGALLGVSPVEWAILALTIGAVIAAELFNTVIEALVNLVSPEWHPLARVAKDVAAAAVLCLAFVAVAVGLAIFIPHWGEWLAWLLKWLVGDLGVGL